MSKIVIGTSNPGKIREIASILSPLGYELQPEAFDVKEIGETIQENAEIKGVEYSKLFPEQYVIAEDSGLAIPKLGGLPGAYSARFHTCKVGEGYKIEYVPEENFSTDKTETDRLNNEALIPWIEGLSFEERGAYFEVCFVVAKDGKILFSTASRAEGYVIPELRGTNGFGYDPLFVGNDTFGNTYAELDSARKNLRSHRKRAISDLAMWLTQNIES
ncbi:MAG: non-canonical purine NTP pyrophosphatase [Candidatus Peribacteria bacterium]|jgi:non-canonical purine NTP pyrophosphatase (RdgB/HAM1 family)|nr:non-canonical purine NTP pyrophosphatase [Candidatus Peribacteria bacterium]